MYSTFYNYLPPPPLLQVIGSLSQDPQTLLQGIGPLSLPHTATRHWIPVTPHTLLHDIGSLSPTKHCFKALNYYHTPSNVTRHALDPYHPPPPTLFQCIGLLSPPNTATRRYTIINPRLQALLQKLNPYHSPHTATMPSNIIML